MSKKNIRFSNNNRSKGSGGNLNEIPMPQNLIESLFDSSMKLGFETKEERDYRYSKEKYNKAILRKIKKTLTELDPDYFQVKITQEQLILLNLLFKKGFNLTDSCKAMDISISRGQLLRNAVFKKLRKKIKYNFIYDDKKS